MAMVKLVVKALKLVVVAGRAGVWYLQVVMGGRMVNVIVGPLQFPCYFFSLNANATTNTTALKHINNQPHPTNTNVIHKRTWTTTLSFGSRT